ALNRARNDRSPGQGSFGAAAARLLREQAAELDQELRAATSPDDEAAIHGARIAVKRVRYLIESLAIDVADAAALVARCKELQDLLGGLDAKLAELGSTLATFAEALIPTPRLPLGRSSRPLRIRYTARARP